MSTPTALHSDQSAMVLLHTVLPALMITGQDRPGEWAEEESKTTHKIGSVPKFMGGKPYLSPYAERYFRMKFHNATSLFVKPFFLFRLIVGGEPSVKNYAGRQPMRVPIALHNTPSAMGLLHTIPPALLITERDRPGK